MKLTTHEPDNEVLWPHSLLACIRHSNAELSAPELRTRIRVLQKNLATIVYSMQSQTFAKHCVWKVEYCLGCALDMHTCFCRRKVIFSSSEHQVIQLSMLYRSWFERVTSSTIWKEPFSLQKCTYSVKQDFAVNLNYELELNCEENSE